MAISNSRLAKEWLIFVPLFLLGGPVCFFADYYRADPTVYKGATPTSDTALSASWDAFWNYHFGFTHAWSIFLWFVPYLVVMLVRSLAWAASVAFKPCAHRNE